MSRIQLPETGQVSLAVDTTVRRRAEAIGRDLDELRNTGLAGSPDEIVDKINLLASLGTERVYLQVLDSFDLDHLADIATTVLPQLG